MGHGGRPDVRGAFARAPQALRGRHRRGFGVSGRGDDDGQADGSWQRQPRQRCARPFPQKGSCCAHPRGGVQAWRRGLCHPPPQGCCHSPLGHGPPRRRRIPGKHARPSMLHMLSVTLGLPLTAIRVAWPPRSSRSACPSVPSTARRTPSPTSWPTGTSSASSTPACPSTSLPSSRSGPRLSVRAAAAATQSGPAALYRARLTSLALLLRSRAVSRRALLAAVAPHVRPRALQQGLGLADLTAAPERPSDPPLPVRACLLQYKRHKQKMCVGLPLLNRRKKEGRQQGSCCEQSQSSGS